MNIQMTNSAQQFLTQLSGRFDFSTRAQFVEQIVNLVEATTATEIKVDLSGVDYIDSSALGMLLMLRDKARRHEKTVVLTGIQGAVKQIIKTAQFDKLFPIH